MKKNKNYFYVFLLPVVVTIIYLVIIGEIYDGVRVDDFLYIKSFLSIISVFIISRMYKENKKILNIILLFFTVFFIINILLNMVNVYQLNRFGLTNYLCSSNLKICKISSDVFFKLKIFRFITISSYFFSIPILILHFANILSNQKFSYNLSLNKKMFYFFIAMMIFSNMIFNIQKIYLSAIQSVQVLNENYYDRFTFKKGGVSYYGWIRVFSNFILDNTSENDSFLLPPQSDIYKMEGNIDYFRWFLYPRKLYHVEDLDNKGYYGVNYIIISAGECDTNDCVWPDFDVPSSNIEKIILIDRKTQKITELHDSDYKYEKFYKKWGIIKLK